MKPIVTKSTVESYNDLISLMSASKRVFYSRFGDGQLYGMQDRDAANHLADDNLKAELLEAFLIRDPNYMIALAINIPHEKGMTDGVLESHKSNPELENFVIENELNKGIDAYHNPILFHYQALFDADRLIRFLDEYIRPKRKMYIGCVPKQTAEKLFGPIDYYVETPAKNSFAEIDRWWPEVLKNVNDVEVVIPATGSATSVINLRLWNMGVNVHCIDIGSIVDAIDPGVHTRKWIRLMGYKVNRILLEEYQDKRLSTVIKNSVLDLKNSLRSIFYSLRS
jgi:hypothetical protein